MPVGQTVPLFKVPEHSLPPDHAVIEFSRRLGTHSVAIWAVLWPKHTKTGCWPTRGSRTLLQSPRPQRFLPVFLVNLAAKRDPEQKMENLQQYLAFVCLVTPDGLTSTRAAGIRAVHCRREQSYQRLNPPCIMAKRFKTITALCAACCLL